MSTTVPITWRETAKELPDAELNVLLWNNSDSVFEGFLGGMDDNGRLVWRDVTGLSVDDVTHWADLPDGPRAAA